MLVGVVSFWFIKDEGNQRFIARTCPSLLLTFIGVRWVNVAAAVIKLMWKSLTWRERSERAIKCSTRAGSRKSCWLNAAAPPMTSQLRCTMNMWHLQSTTPGINVIDCSSDRFMTIRGTLAHLGLMLTWQLMARWSTETLKSTFQFVGGWRSGNLVWKTCSYI